MTAPKLCAGCGETFAGPDSHAAHKAGPRCVPPAANTALTRRPDGAWRLTTIPGQLTIDEAP